MQKVLEYSQWRRFNEVIEKAKISCIVSNNNVNEHFADVGKVLSAGNNAKMIVDDYKLSRYACYLIAQNGDSRKKVIALAQTYFAIQTRKQEILEKDYNLMTEEEKRIYNRSLTKKGNYSLNKLVSKRGVKDFAKFHNEGYKGLYNGETADDIARRKGLRYREDILDNMGNSELIMNLFRIDQTNQKITNEKIIGQNNCNQAHYEVGKKVRKTIKELGGTMPEDLPTPNKSLKELEQEKRKN